MAMVWFLCYADIAIFWVYLLINHEMACKAQISRGDHERYRNKQELVELCYVCPVISSK